MANNDVSDPVGPSVSAVVCVYTEDRWDAIVESVSSIQSQTVAPREVVVVVDHNLSLLNRCMNELPGVVVVPNTEQPGLAGARNTGVASSGGDVVAFLDDDARAEPDWLARLLAHYTEPDVLGVGGRIDPDWGGPRPSPLPREFDWVVGCSYVGLPTAPGQVLNGRGIHAGPARCADGAARVAAR